jgi:hypothetical protein
MFETPATLLILKESPDRVFLPLYDFVDFTLSKKVIDFPVPSRENLPGRENLIIPGQGEFG